MKCAACSSVFKAEIIDGRVTCPSCGARMKVKAKPVNTEEPVVRKEVSEKKVVKAEKVVPMAKPKVNAYDALRQSSLTPKKLSNEEVDAFVSFASDVDTRIREEKAYEEDKTDEFYDEFADDDYEKVAEQPKVKSKKVESRVKQESAVEGNELTLLDYVVASILSAIPVAGLLVTVLGCFGIIFKKKAGFKVYFNWLLIYYAIQFVMLAIAVKVIDLPRIIMSLPLN